jgi:hypothetical protein
VTITGANVSGTANVSTLVVTGNQSFVGTGNRITGDFSNATFTNRVAFQTSTANSATTVNAIPSGTGTVSQFIVHNAADPGNASRSGVNCSGTLATFFSDQTGTGTYLPMVFNTGGAEAMRITNAGATALFGFGTSTPAVKLDVNGITSWQGSTTGQTAQVVGASSGINGGSNFRVLSNTTQAVDVGGSISLGGYYIGITQSIDYAQIIGAKENSTSGNAAGYLAFGTRPAGGNMAERMRIDSSGNLLVGKTATGLASSGFEANATGMTASNSGAEAANFNRNTSDGTVVLFRRSSAGVGTIGVTTTATSYNTSSDYRLKNTIAPMTGALAKLALLKPCTYKWKLDNSDGEGFIAHELQEVVPYAVSGEKDGEQMQGVDYSKLTPILTAALQEAIAKIENLEARIAVLEAK